MKIRFKIIGLDFCVKSTPEIYISDGIPKDKTVVKTRHTSMESEVNLTKVISKWSLYFPTSIYSGLIRLR